MLGGGGYISGSYLAINKVLTGGLSAFCQSKFCSGYEFLGLSELYQIQLFNYADHRYCELSQSLLQHRTGHLRQAGLEQDDVCD